MLVTQQVCWSMEWQEQKVRLLLLVTLGKLNDFSKAQFSICKVEGLLKMVIEVPFSYDVTVYACPVTGYCPTLAAP